MANGMRNASSIINQLKYQPIKQKELAGAVAQEGYDNKAVSQYDRMLGKQVAGEQKRLHALDEFGSDLAMRKDKLAFSQKMQKEQESMADERLDMAASGFKKKQFSDYLGAGLSATATGINFYRDRKVRKENEAFRKELRADIAVMKDAYGIKRGAMLGYTLDHSGNTTNMYNYRGEY